MFGPASTAGTPAGTPSILKAFEEAEIQDISLARDPANENIEVIADETPSNQPSTEVEAEVTSNNAETKLFTPEEVNEIVKKRIGALKAEKIDAAAAEIQKTTLEEKQDLEKRIALMERENLLLKLASNETERELLAETGLSGDNLIKFAEKLKANASIGSVENNKKFEAARLYDQTASITTDTSSSNTTEQDFIEFFNQQTRRAYGQN